MGFPHPTPHVPGRWPHLEAEVAAVPLTSPEATRLLRALDVDAGSTADDTASGHVCATTWVFSPDAHHLILVQHSVFTWSIPGGHIELHETSRMGGLRELEEETGLTSFDVRAVFDHPALVHVTDVPNPLPHRHWNIAWLYVCHMDAPLSPVEGARWFAVDALPDGAPDLLATARRARQLLIER
ncbi:MAG: NUDIX domain-containing protein [Ilumatobacteraceae bacterium]